MESRRTGAQVPPPTGFLAFLLVQSDAKQPPWAGPGLAAAVPTGRGARGGRGGLKKNNPAPAGGRVLIG